MLLKTYEQLLARLPAQIPFRYQKGAYALMLLRWAIGPGRSIRELRASPLAALLDKPAVRAALARVHDGVLRPQHLWLPAGPAFDYVLTFGGYEGEDRDDQVSRPGVNLVVQVNFDARHDARLEQLVPDNRELFMAGGHPIHGELNTLAWARIDLTDTTPDARGRLRVREALIEEVQTDWVREAKDQHGWAKAVVAGGLEAAGDETTLRLACGLSEYVEHVLAPHTRHWDELTLAAALWVLREKLRVPRIFAHTWESGLALKGMHDYPPPRSLYTKLPRRFGFGKTQTYPDFLTGSVHEVVQPTRHLGARCEPALPGLHIHRV